MTIQSFECLHNFIYLVDLRECGSVVDEEVEIFLDPTEVGLEPLSFGLGECVVLSGRVVGGSLVVSLMAHFIYYNILQAELQYLLFQ